MNHFGCWFHICILRLFALRPLAHCMPKFLKYFESKFLISVFLPKNQKISVIVIFRSTYSPDFFCVEKNTKMFDQHRLKSDRQKNGKNYYFFAWLKFRFFIKKFIKNFLSIWSFYTVAYRVQYLKSPSPEI